MYRKNVIQQKFPLIPFSVTLKFFNFTNLVYYFLLLLLSTTSYFCSFSFFSSLYLVFGWPTSGSGSISHTSSDGGGGGLPLSIPVPAAMAENSQSGRAWANCPSPSTCQAVWFTSEPQWQRATGLVGHGPIQHILFLTNKSIIVLSNIRS